MDESVPDPVEQALAAVETVRVIKSDFDLLQQVANWAVEDVETLGKILCMFKPADMSPREFLIMRLMPRIAQLMQTQARVDEASAELLERAKSKGMVTKDFGNGVKGLLVGEKIPGLFDKRG